MVAVAKTDGLSVRAGTNPDKVSAAAKEAGCDCDLN